MNKQTKNLGLTAAVLVAGLTIFGCKAPRMTAQEQRESSIAAAASYTVASLDSSTGIATVNTNTQPTTAHPVALTYQSVTGAAQRYLELDSQADQTPEVAELKTALVNYVQGALRVSEGTVFAHLNFSVFEGQDERSSVAGIRVRLPEQMKSTSDLEYLANGLTTPTALGASPVANTPPLQTREIMELVANAQTRYHAVGAGRVVSRDAAKGMGYVRLGNVQTIGTLLNDASGRLPLVNARGETTTDAYDATQHTNATKSRRTGYDSHGPLRLQLVLDEIPAGTYTRR